MEPKIKLDKFKEIKKLKGEIGAHLDTFTENMENFENLQTTLQKSLKIVQTDYKKMSDILEEIRKTTDIDSFD